MDQSHGMLNANTTSPTASDSESTIDPYSAASIQGSRHQEISSLSQNVLQAHATLNPPWPPPPYEPSLFPLSPFGSLSPANLPTQETNLAWQCVPEGGPPDVRDGSFSGRVDETDHHLYQSNNDSFQVADSSHSARYVTVHHRSLQSFHVLCHQLYQL